MNRQPSDLEKHWDRIYRHQEKDFRASSLNPLISSMVKPGKVLDIGCGTGGLSLILLKKGYEVTSQDISAEMVKRCRQIFQEEGFNPNQVRQAGVEELIEVDEFDNVIALDVIEHIEDDNRAVRQMFKVLKPGGQLVLSVPAHQFLFGPKDTQLGHFRRYSKKSLISVVSTAGFQITSIRYWNVIGLIPVYLMVRVFKKKVSEEFRYKSEGGLSGFLNQILKLWFRYIENPVSMPLGLTLIIQAEKSNPKGLKDL